MIGLASRGNQMDTVMELDHSKLYAVIMAGGRGERFWPLSRADQPKQMLSLLGGASLIEQTVLRLRELLPPENIIIVTNERYVERLHRMFPRLPEENIIGEPAPRDTGPCVALAAGVVRARAGEDDATMMLFPADHCIVNVEAFRRNLEDGCRMAARGDFLVTIGIPPTEPSCNYGYIKAAERVECPLSTCFHRVACFVEKPSREAAEKMLSEGGYSWNGGIFLWKVATILKAMRLYAPDLADLAGVLHNAWCGGVFTEVLKREFEKCRKISIDYAVMEKADNILVGEASFDWDDIGNWPALRNHLPTDSANNVLYGLAEQLDCRDTILYSGDPEHLVAAIGLEDVIVVHTQDATLVCRSGSSKELKELLSRLRKKENTWRFL